MILKQVVHFPDTNSVEATWVTREQLPDIEVPESFGPTTRAEDGTIVPGEVIPAHVVQGGIKETVARCHSYADVQMDMLRADLAEFGGDVAEHEALIAQVEAGIVPPGPPPPPVVPVSVSMRQARLALIDAGLIDSVEAAIGAIADPVQRRKAQTEWEYAQEVQRHHGLVPAMAQALGMTDAQLDQLFLLAGTL